MRIRHCVERADMPVSLDRRSLVAGAAGAVGVAALGGLSRALGSPSDLLRPPGGQDETAFVAKCLKCDRCQSVCEPDCIGLARNRARVGERAHPVFELPQGVLHVLQPLHRGVPHRARSCRSIRL